MKKFVTLTLSIFIVSYIPFVVFADTNCGTVGDNTSNLIERIGQSGADSDHPFAAGAKFSATQTATANSSEARISLFNSPADNFRADLEADVAGVPSGVSLATYTIPAGSLTGSFVNYTTNFTVSTAVVNGTTYWLVYSRSGSGDNTNAYNVSYSAGSTGRAVYYSGAWHADTAVIYYADLFCSAAAGSPVPPSVTYSFWW